MPKVFMYQPVKDQTQQWVIDEVCTCGDLMSHHEMGVMVQGHGKCTDCGCVQFTWQALIYANNP